MRTDIFCESKAMSSERNTDSRPVTYWLKSKHFPVWQKKHIPNTSVHRIHNLSWVLWCKGASCHLYICIITVTSNVNCRQDYCYIQHKLLACLTCFVHKLWHLHGEKRQIWIISCMTKVLHTINSMAFLEEQIMFCEQVKALEKSSVEEKHKSKESYCISQTMSLA